MALPKKLTDLIAKRDTKITALIDALTRDAKNLQTTLYESILNELAGKLEVSDGVILNTEKNLEILQDIDELYKGFTNKSLTDTVTRMANGYNQIATLNTAYFEAMPMIKPTQFKNILARAKTFMNATVGLKGKNVVSGGFLDRFLTDQTIINDVKQFVVKGVTGQQNFKEFTKELKTLVQGAEDAEGKFERYYRQYAYDSFQQYDSIYGGKVAEDLGLKHFIYTGGLIQDSREFCQEHNGHVYTTEEAEEWKNWTPSKAVYKSFPDAKNPNTVPSYISQFPGYTPLRDRGGFNCRHQISYITESLAEIEREE